MAPAEPYPFGISAELPGSFQTADILPISSTTWECVAEVHLSRHPNMDQMVDSLKQKFKELHNKKVSTAI
jgi:hypothetical protein